MSSSKSKAHVKWTAITTFVIPILVAYILFQRAHKSSPIIKIKDGEIVGIQAFSRNGTVYWEYLGIPFATPPVGKLRFQPPVPVKPWKGLKHTTKYPQDCTQFEGIGRRRLAGVENCLYLNVYTHPFNLNGSVKPLRPVMVNIPGGGFQWGGSQYYKPTYFMDFPDIVIVNIQYRLGALGFINFQKEGLPRGNMGLKDIVLALEWVQKNIAYFGGDPNRVTCYGQSAGAVSAHLLMLSPKSQNLVHRVFSQSGTAISHFGVTTKPRELALNLAKKLGCPLNDKEKLLECLQSADHYDIVIHQKCTSDPTEERDIFVASVETVVTEDTFLAQHPYEILKNGNFTSKPVVFGMGSGEGALRLAVFDGDSELVEKVQVYWNEYVGNVLGFEKFPAGLAEKVRHFYYPNSTSFPDDPQEFKDQLSLMVADSSVYEAIHTAAEIHAVRGNKSPVHLLMYDYRPTGAPGMYTFYKAVKPGGWLNSELLILYVGFMDWMEEHFWGTGKGAHAYGAAHSEEMLLIWGVDKLASYMFSQKDVEFSQDYVKSVIDFVSGRDPVSFRGVTWPTINNVTEPFPMLLIDQNGNASVIQEPFTERIRFWRELGIRNFV